MGPWLVLPIKITVNLGLRTATRYSTLPKYAELKPQHQRVMPQTNLQFQDFRYDSNHSFNYVIHHHHHHHHVVRPARISLTLSLHVSLSFIASGRSSGLHPVSSHSGCSSWSSCFWLLICGGPQEYITYDLVLASPAVSGMSGSSCMNSFCDGW